VDHVVITGDLTNLALETEFELVKRFLREELGLGADAVSLIPGNHDAYTRGAHRSRRFETFLGEYMTSDLPDATGVPDIGRFPYVRLRGPVAIIGLCSAVPRLPLFASGELGKPQRMALRSVLAHREVQDRIPILLQHHPWHRPGGMAKTLLKGLSDADEELDVLEDIERGMLLHGHLHRRIHRRIDTRAGHLDAIGSTSASLLNDDVDRMSGFNIYEIDEAGALRQVEGYRFEPATGDFVPTPVPFVPSA
jgi:3',5'-cyclic AMP phosphodiesterase CpdA